MRFWFSSSRDSNVRRGRYDNSYYGRPFREREREIDSDLYQQQAYAVYRKAAGVYHNIVFLLIGTLLYQNI
ncbi:chromodomain-helicase-DNA-binding protein 1-like [Aphis craccivora]|uniref:Chromodomain-helicase-DNA-binding protein 1-like n=1 Tax=Aphis craccivora TaxID=307492 RepID=A0A6G0XWR4_APHCR|nr:chromodomain-helicase-DNA-binding protein 1-like [Aphis craccivora]